MKTCSTCRFWSAPHYDPNPRFPSCTDVPAKQGYGECDRMDWLDEEYTHNNTTDGALQVDAADDTGLTARFRCKSNFGCTMHQEKTNG